MSLVASLRNLFADRRSSATKTLVAIAKKEAAGKATEQDLAELERALVAAHGSEVQREYGDLVALVRRGIELRATASRIPALTKAALAAAKERDAFAAETEKLAAARRAQQWALETAAQNADVALRDASRGLAQLQVMEFRHPEVMEAEAFNLDEYRLTYRETGIGNSDPDAPSREVPLEVFQTETGRRCHLLAIARAQEAARHRTECAQWMKDRSEGFSWGSLLDKPEPALREIVWRDLIDAKSPLLALTPEEAQARRDHIATSTMAG